MKTKLLKFLLLVLLTSCGVQQDELPTTKNSAFLGNQTEANVMAKDTGVEKKL
jgi:hypothetical protein